MTAPEVDWVLDKIANVTVSDYTLSNQAAVSLERVNRDDSKLLEGDIRSRKGELQNAVFAGAHFADVTRDYIGTEADFDKEVVVGVRIEGLHADEFGHVDPDGNDGIPFETLITRIQDEINSRLSHPTVSGGSGRYKDVLIANEAPQSSTHRDFYRFDFDCLFHKFEDRT